MRMMVAGLLMLLVVSPLGVRAQVQPGAAAPQEFSAPPQVQANERVMSRGAQLTPGSRIYVAPMPNGFDMYVVAGLQKKQVPLVLVTSRERADYEMTGVSETDRAGWAHMLFLGNSASDETASVKLVDLTSGEVVFAYSVRKENSARGKQSAAESVAKHLKEKLQHQ